MVNSAHENAIRQLKDLHGIIFRDNSLTHRPVIEVDMARTSADDSILPLLQNLESFERLFLDETRVTDKVLEVLRAHPEIKRLLLRDTEITDEGLSMLQYVPSLERLYLGNNITDRGFKNVEG